MRRKYYDSENRRLVYFTEAATPDFWDRMWNRMRTEDRQLPKRPSLYARVTHQYLSSGTKVLEGGCGLADLSRELKIAGYEVIAADYAPQAVSALKDKYPEIQPVQCDVRNMPFPDGFFQGYWSLGVIEHFTDGYQDILREAFRVLTPGGYFFLTFPGLNPYRFKKAIRQGYPPLASAVTETSENFYQFALDPVTVMPQLNAEGFEIAEVRFISALNGMNDEGVIPGQLLAALRKLPLLMTAFSILAERTVARYFGHSCLIVARKTR